MHQGWFMSCPGKLLDAYAVNTKVNLPVNDRAELIERAGG